VLVAKAEANNPCSRFAGIQPETDFQQTRGTNLRTTFEPEAPEVVAIHFLIQMGIIGLFGEFYIPSYFWSYVIQIQDASLNPNFNQMFVYI